MRHCSLSLTLKVADQRSFANEVRKAVPRFPMKSNHARHGHHLTVQAVRTEIVEFAPGIKHLEESENCVVRRSAVKVVICLVELGQRLPIESLPSPLRLGPAKLACIGGQQIDVICS